MKKQYLGKKKRYTRKNIVIYNKKQRILCVSFTHDGRIHDKTQLEKSGFLGKIPDKFPKWFDKAFQKIWQ
ncbi:MAG: transposase family protein [Oscillospiraceae bacterium]|nr:transposase family protein [Oscillospiraceae bacterium]